MKSYPQRTPQQLADIIESACLQFNKSLSASGRKDKRIFSEESAEIIKKLARKNKVKYRTLLNILMYEESVDTKKGERNTKQRHRIAHG